MIKSLLTSVVLLPVAFIFICGCKNNTKSKNDIISDSTGFEVTLKPTDTAKLKVIVNNPDSAAPVSHTPTVLNARTLKTEDFIKQYPAGSHEVLKQYIEHLKKEWQNVPNPITATYRGNEFGDYHHILFKDIKGATYDFGQANNNYGAYKLHEPSGQYADNPKYLGKKFKVHWDWKLADFLCCEGEYGKAKAYLPTITKLELIKK